MPGTTEQVVRYLKAHPPRGARPGYSGASGGGGKPTVTARGSRWPPIRARLSSRWLIVAVVQLKDGSTGVRADGEVVWITPRHFGWRIRLSFYADRSAGASSRPPLAVAVVDPNGCGEVQLTLAGRRQRPLTGGYRVTKRLSTVLHVKLDSGGP